MIFSKHRRKLEPHRRFGSPIFRAKLKEQAGYKRTSLADRLSMFSFRSKSLRVAAILLAAVIGYYLFVSDQFLVKEIAVAGNKQVDSSKIQEAWEQASAGRIFLIPKNHYLLSSRDRVNAEITARISDVKEVVKTDRQGLHKLLIEIQERNPGFVFLAQGRRFLVDEDGTIVKEISENPGLVEVENQVAEDVVVGEILPNPKLVAFIISMHKSWPTKITSPVTAVKVPGKGSPEVQFQSSEGWTVFFDVNRSSSSQLDSLGIVLSKQISATDRIRLAYIDMRSEKWIYYCYRGAPCNAEPTQ
jgi:cell division septal protein FtsQ